MSVLSVTCCALFSAVCAFTLVSASGCGTDAQGVDACRDIEEARCTSAKSCGTVSDVAECQRFYRDQCLHGLAVASPGTAAINACVATIRQAGLCATPAPTTLLDACTPSVSLSAPLAKTACDVVANPQYAEECAFLVPTVDAGTAGSGGTAATAGSGGGTGGSSGTSDGGASGSEDVAGSAGTGGA
jgi:hypothetical protein